MENVHHIDTARTGKMESGVGRLLNLGQIANLRQLKLLFASCIKSTGRNVPNLAGCAAAEENISSGCGWKPITFGTDQRDR